jgi:hypothetical protein
VKTKESGPHQGIFLAQVGTITNKRRTTHLNTVSLGFQDIELEPKVKRKRSEVS